ncbi:DNA polymerase III subunit [Stratiformator vulcanicus]|uniref:DNA polymerase III subunit tau n=1 Tax=Stratiformator vulcanicus TaxID=2527980 RepID=A0A517QXQ9_9PLAN|nr:DNA polymerase III subunit [Stratiformator vulcanicus]QDT36394.1 DNA polymerase III subunit tau [Stratiformator vulcanicus]
MNSPWQTLRGHNDRIEQFRRAASRGRIAQAYLLVGPGGIGKRLFARICAQCFFCTETPPDELEACGHCPSCVRMASGTHPDLVEIGLPDGKRQLLIEQFVGDRESRGRQGLCHELALSPTEARRKVAVIDAADRMGEEAANAFLKTLEEPPADALMFLIAESTSAILPTILSRCQTVLFPPLTAEIVAELLLQSETVDNRDEAISIGRLCEGSLDTAATLLDPGLRELKSDLDRSLDKFPIDAASISKMVTEKLDAVGDTPAQRAAMSWVIRFAVDHYRRVLRAASGSPTDGAVDSSRLSTQLRNNSVESADFIGDCIERLAEADLSISRNVSLPLCVETLFADLARAMRRIA